MMKIETIGDISKEVLNPDGTPLIVRFKSEEAYALYVSWYCRYWVRTVSVAHYGDTYKVRRDNDDADKYYLGGSEPGINYLGRITQEVFDTCFESVPTP